MKKNLLLLACFGILVGCSTKKDTFKNRTFHRTTSWFNTLFNAEKEMDKKLEALEFEYQDNYSEILPVDPRPEIKEYEFSEEFINQQSSSFKPNSNSSNTPSAEGFQLVEQKALKAIDRHSMMINGVERNKAMTRAYLILGKARYNQGKGFEALEALNYLQSKLPEHKKFTPEAKLYTALANIQIGNVFEGERLLTTLYKDDGYKKPFKEEVSKHFAQLLIDHEVYDEALKALDNTISNTKNKKRRARYHFIEGQIYSRLGMQNEAGEAFTKVFQLKPGFEMEVKSQLGIAANFDPEINSYNSYKEHLLNVAKNGNYLSRKNELLFAIGDIAIKADRKDEARKYLKESFEGPASDPYIRARAYERYADLEFNEGNYVHATAYYDSALAIAPYNKDIERITERNNSLKFLMEKHYLVIRNDSILKLASMSKEEQEDYFKDYIAKLKIEDAKRQKQIEEEATIFQTQTRGIGAFDSSFGTGGNTFYFYNASAKANGQNEFKKVWGNIRLTDNWRSSAGASMSLEEREAEMLGQVDNQNPRRYELEYYIEQIPTRTGQLNRLKIERDTTQLSLGIGYYDLFKNDEIATTTLESLLKSPPKEDVTEAQAMYQLFRINDRAGNRAKADQYKNEILTKYPNSIYAGYILNPDFDFITPTTQEALALYEETYLLYKDEKFDEVKANIQTATEKYSSEAITAKFTLLNAMVIGKTEGVDEFINALELVTIVYQNTDEAKRAQEILDLLRNRQSAVTENEGGESTEVQREKESIMRSERGESSQAERNRSNNRSSVNSRSVNSQTDKSSAAKRRN